MLSNTTYDVPELQPCNHSEADTWLILHLSNAAAQGNMTAFIRTVNRDVIILAIWFFPILPVSQLWVGFGSGKYRDIPVHDVCQQLGPSTSLILALFHALTGCDTTSHFLGCEKKSAWTAWANIPGFTETLVALTHNPHILTIQSNHKSCTGNCKCYRAGVHCTGLCKCEGGCINNYSYICKWYWWEF